MRFRQLNTSKTGSDLCSGRTPGTVTTVRQRSRGGSRAFVAACCFSTGVAHAETASVPAAETQATETQPAKVNAVDATTGEPTEVPPVTAMPGPPVLKPALPGARVNGTGVVLGDNAAPLAAPVNKEPDRAYRERFERARTALIDNRDEEALAEFEALEKDAPTAEDRRVAEEFATLARERVSARQRELPPPHLRTTDELSVLYTTAFTYGFGTSAWLALQVKPSNFAAAVLPFVAITGAAVGGVALVDSYSPFRLGVPQSISAGTLLGTLEGVWLAGYQNAVASRRDEQSWRSPTVATVLWAGATLGGVAGGLLGAVREPTPGQVSYTTSGGLWGGIAGALIAGAAESQTSYRAERAYAVGALGYNLALIAALATSPQLAPSVARVRLVDLGGLAGGLLGAGGYLLVADEGSSSRAAMGAAAGGALLGLGLSWWATSGMPEEPHPHAEETLLSRLRPTVIPVRQGAVGVLELTL
jgi:hypothetical protein